MKPDDIPETPAARTPLPHPVEWSRVLNGREPGQRPKPCNQVRLVVA